MTARLELLAAGPLTTIQDCGRRGFLRFGVTHAGPMDRAAYQIANAAAGNPPEAPAIELSLGGATLLCQGAPLGFALAGGGFSATIDGTAVGGNAAHNLLPGQRLMIRESGAGNWAILALAGSLVAPRWLGSSATHSQSGLGGGLLVRGATLTIEAPRQITPGPLPKQPQPASEFRVLLGPQDRFFDAQALAALTARAFVATGSFNRMGRLLEGPALVPIRLDMPSEPILRGALQLDGTGLMTILLADHQTTGGYPRIGYVIDPDIDALAQLSSGSPVRFRAVTRTEAQAAAQSADARLSAAVHAAANRLHPLERLLHLNLIDGAVDAIDPL